MTSVLSASYGRRTARAPYAGVVRDPCAPLGDIIGDGLADFAIAPRAGEVESEVLVVFGKADTDAVDLAAIRAGDGGFRIVSEAADGALYCGDDPLSAMREAGDIDGDGRTDLVLGACGIAKRGRAYVVFSARRRTPSLRVQPSCATPPF